MEDFRFLLVDTNKQVTDAWETVFAGIPNVTVINDSIFNHPCDVIVSPANSFGFMNGGIDFAISKNLGWHVEKKVQQIIRDKYFGELLVGQADIVHTEHADFPYLIAAPTMRTPMTIHRGPNVYHCMKAILQLLRYGRLEDGRLMSNRIQSIAIPGLGTGIGQVAPMVCARQMRLAWEDVVHEKWKTKEGWSELRSNYAYFFTHNESDLKYDIP